MTINQINESNYFLRQSTYLTTNNCLVATITCIFFATIIFFISNTKITTQAKNLSINPPLSVKQFETETTPLPQKTTQPYFFVKDITKNHEERILLSELTARGKPWQKKTEELYQLALKRRDQTNSRRLFQLNGRLDSISFMSTIFLRDYIWVKETYEKTSVFISGFHTDFPISKLEPNAIEAAAITSYQTDDSLYMKKFLSPESLSLPEEIHLKASTNSSENPNKVYLKIEDLATHPDNISHPKGAGKGIVLHLFQKCLKEDLSGIIAASVPTARTFYEKIGFRNLGEQPKEKGNAESETFKMIITAEEIERYLKTQTLGISTTQNHQIT